MLATEQRHLIHSHHRESAGLVHRLQAGIERKRRSGSSRMLAASTSTFVHIFQIDDFFPSLYCCHQSISLSGGWVFFPQPTGSFGYMEEDLQGVSLRTQKAPLSLFCACLVHNIEGLPPFEILKIIMTNVLHVHDTKSLESGDRKFGLQGHPGLQQWF